MNLPVNAVYGQHFGYVNTDNLIIRDRPEQKYMVTAIAHRHCKLQIEPYDAEYQNNKAVRSRFLQVSVNYYDDDKVNHHIGGWVERRYVDTFPGSGDEKAETGAELRLSKVTVVPFLGEDRGDPNKWNYGDFQPPKYKGGVTAPQPERRIYHKGKRGGCYYVDKKGRKVYVAKSLCNGK